MKGKMSLLASFITCLRKRKKSISSCIDPYGSPGWQAIDNDKVPSVKKLFWKKTGAAGGFHVLPSASGMFVISGAHGGLQASVPLYTPAF